MSDEVDVAQQIRNMGYSVNRNLDPEFIKKVIAGLHPVTTAKKLVRVGGEMDGGYLVPDDFDGIVGCFSPGVAVTSTFEQGIVARGIPCYLADASVESPPVKHPMMQFEKKFVGVVNDATTFTLDTWVDAYAPGYGDLLLQMDIEGAEYPCLINVSDKVLSRFRIIVCEFHFIDRMVDEAGFLLLSSVWNRLLRYFHVVHVHPNNALPPVEMAGGLVLPQLLEFSFLRKDRAQPAGFVTEFPHPLDRPNLPNRPDLALPPLWHR